MQEHACRFGRASHLIGITGQPHAAANAADGVGVIVLNAGLVHRIGPFRLHVEMTRHLNAIGYPTLRFDLSTLGDSSASGEPQSHEQQVCADVADAIALLSEQSSCTRFILIGLCSGAANAHLVARSDARVAGAIFLDGYAYRSFGFQLRHYLPRILNAVRSAHSLVRRMRLGRQLREPSFGVEFPSRDKVRGDLVEMLERGLKLCFIYSGGFSKYFNHCRQFRECFGSISSHPGISVRFFKETDHTYILTCDRMRLLDNIDDWMRGNFPIVASHGQA